MAASVDVVDDLYSRLTLQRESFWTTVYPLYMQREITRTHVRDVVRKGLEEARGNYKIMVELFNMEAGDYKKFLNFLRKHQCQLPFKDYRQVSHIGHRAPRRSLRAHRSGLDPESRPGRIRSGVR